MLSDLLYFRIVGNKNRTHNDILKKLIVKKWAGVIFLFSENFTWIISANNESVNKNIWIVKTCWNVRFILNACTSNKLTASMVINKIVLLFFIITYNFFNHVVQC